MIREENKPRTGPPDKKMLFAKSLREIEALRLRQRRRLMNVSLTMQPSAIAVVATFYRAPKCASDCWASRSFRVFSNLVMWESDPSGG